MVKRGFGAIVGAVVAIATIGVLGSIAPAKADSWQGSHFRYADNDHRDWRGDDRHWHHWDGHRWRDYGSDWNPGPGFRGDRDRDDHRDWDRRHDRDNRHDWDRDR